MGNICRSPTGEGVFQSYVESENNADKIFIDSAGTLAYHQGEPADARMMQAAGKRNYQLNSIARKVISQDIETFDLIVAIDRDNLFELESIAGGEKQHIRLLGSFLNDGSHPCVPDPYYGGNDGFEQVLDMIEEACHNMLSHCLDLFGKKNP